jgi:hypothetical protein
MVENFGQGCLHRSSPCKNKAVVAKSGAKVAIVRFFNRSHPARREQIPIHGLFFNICVHFCASTIAFLHPII